MKTIRFLQQPGPVGPSRVESLRGGIEALDFMLRPGMTLDEAVTLPMVAAGFQCGSVSFTELAVDPLHYVRPAPAIDALHVAYFSAPFKRAGRSRIEQANATFGWANGKPFIHCHAVWVEPDGSRRGGHILPHDTIVAETGIATGWGCRTIRIEALHDEETNFILFQPIGTSTGPGMVVRIRPNEDIVGAVESLAASCGITDGVVRGGVGSLIGARFTDGGVVDDYATEVLVRRGFIRDGKASLDLLVVDMQGCVHQGVLLRGENPVCITFELMLDGVA